MRRRRGVLRQDSYRALQYRINDMYTEAREYLRQINIMNRRIQQSREELERLNALKYSISPVISKNGGGNSSPSPDKLEKAIVAAEAYEDKLSKEIVDYIKTVDRVKHTILGLRNKDYADILLYKYVNGYTLRRAGNKMHYSERHAQRLHGYALKALNETKEVQTWYRKQK